MKQTNYTSYASGGSFNPVERTTYLPTLEENTRRLQESEQAQIDQVRRNNEQRVKNAGKEFEGLKELAKFSEKLSEVMIEEEKKENERQMQEGVMQAYMNGVSPEDMMALDAGEAQLKQSHQVTNAAGAEFEQVTGDAPTGNRIRSMSGWKQYGYAMGMAEMAGVNYPAFYEQAKATTTVNLNGREVSYDTAEDSAERAAVESAIRMKYLRSYANINPALLNKYMFPQMRRYEAQAAVDWAKDMQERLSDERATEARDGLYSGFVSGNAGQSYADFITSRSAEVGLGQARKDANEEIKSFLQDDTIHMHVRQQALDQIKNQPVTMNDGQQTTYGERFRRDFGDLEQTLTDAGDEQVTRRRNNRSAVEEEYRAAFEEEARARAARGEKFSDEEIEQLKEDFEADTGSSAPSFFDDYTTADEEQVGKEKETLNRIRATRGFLMESDLDGMSIKTRISYMDRVEADKEFAEPSSKFMQEAKQYAQNIANEAIAGQIGVPGREKTNYADFVRRAAQDYPKLYADAIKQGYAKPIEAHNAALAEMKRKGIVEKTYLKQIELKPNQSYHQQQNSAAKYASANANNPNAFLKEVIPGTQESLTALKNYAKTGRGQIPPLYHYIASNVKDKSAWDIANEQLQAAGEPGLAPPKANALTDGLAPDVKRLLNFKPTRSRASRALGTTNFSDPATMSITPTEGIKGQALDVLGKYESDGVGGYNAVNQIGINDGRGVLGYSGDYRNLGSKALTDMTLGEIMDLQAPRPGMSNDQWIAQGRLHAVGRYQFIGTTLKAWVNRLGISPDTKFTPAVQDRLALALMADQGINPWVGPRDHATAEERQIVQEARNS